MKQLLIIFIVTLSGSLQAQVLIKGQLTDIGNDTAISKARVVNIYTKDTVYADDAGKFSIQVKKGELLEIKKASYDVVRIRIQSEAVSVYKLTMRQTVKEHREALVKEKTFKNDSIQLYEDYKLTLDKPRKDDYNAGNQYAAGLSKKTRQEWAFQAFYEQEIQRKYVDYMFNKVQLEKWTGLKGDRLEHFMDTYRPNYSMLRNMNEYEYLTYVKTCLSMFCPNCEFNVPRFKME